MTDPRLPYSGGRHRDPIPDAPALVTERLSAAYPGTKPIWFHSINDDRLMRALYDYIDALIAADTFVLPAAPLAVLAFNGFAWGASLHGDQPFFLLDSVG